MYCRCGFCLERTNIRWQTNKDRFDILSIPNYVIHKGVFRGRRCGTSDAQQLYHKAHDSSRKSRKKGYESILERFQLSEEYIDSQTKIGWTEETCDHLDKIAAQDQSYTATREEEMRYAHVWKVSLNSSGSNGPMNQRPDYAEAVREKERLPKEAVKECSNIHPSQQTRQRYNHPFSQTSDSYVKTDPQTEWKWYSSSPSSSSTWWQPSRQARGNTSPKV